ncbi:acyl-CoA carboxylase subunit epsilon [Streptomyces sp. A73]|uniref:acyl-CoA carboxylase subunit epsilon n=1 Tax=Streptomyces sp. B15 TaxID=1537797 RepID=UPI001616DF2E|nr:acyl-CoA carboxylase subunit epsilon [Streptomyces sp. B15]MBQ1125195.1 acyl-CoA carboxylase subunit epsilon [Streptomyces sp. B15]MBQ1162927.1 acyl-CoA carboxylase subunit epsilon [Streptomyces sp. A73]
MTIESIESGPGSAEPPIRVVRGNPTPEELAAALAVVRVRASAVAAGEPRRAEPSAWSDPARTVPRSLPAPGPGAWRRTFWPG